MPDASSGAQADRWARAQARLDRLPRPEGRGDALSRWSRRLVMSALVVLVVSAVLLALPALPGGAGLLDHRVPRSRAVAGGVVSLLGVAVEVTGAVLGLVAGAWANSSAAPPLAALDRRQRRRLRQHVLDDAPLDDRRLALARHVAVQLRDGYPAYVWGIGGTLVVAGQGLQRPTVWALVLTGCALAGYPLGLVHQQRASRRAATFLRLHRLPAGHRGWSTG